MTDRRTKTILGTVAFAAGASAIVGSMIIDPVGTDRLLAWGLFALAYAILSLRSVEVNDRMLASSSVMAIATAAVYFALRGDGATSAVVLIAAVGPLDSGDFRKRNVFQPAFNFGLLTVSAFTAGIVADKLLNSGWDPLIDAASFEDSMLFFAGAGAGAAAGAVYALTNFVGLRLGVRVA